MPKSRMLEFDYRLSAYLAFKHAREFRDSASLLDDHRMVKTVVVNIAFSCELYMKALIMWYRQGQSVVDEHKLEKLFNQLEPEDVRQRIKNHVNIQYWETFLKNSSDAFCAWRYYYEKDNVMVGHTGTLFAFAEVLDMICEETISLREFFNGKKER